MYLLIILLIVGVMIVMNGKTFLIIKDLKNMVSVKEISEKFGVSQSAVYQIAAKYEIPKRYITVNERKEKKKIVDAKRNKLKRNKEVFDPNTEMPKLPMTAAKLSPLSSLNSAWIAGQGSKRSTDKDYKSAQVRYGLRT